jgi:uncharacterized protein Veg
MEERNILATIKNEMDDHIGEKVTLRANNGRRKIIVSNGVLEKTYPSIFVVRLEDDTQRTVTYSYSDVLTKTVQIDFAG